MILHLAMTSNLLRTLQIVAEGATWKDGATTALGAAARAKRCKVAQVNDAGAVAGLYSFLGGDRVRDFALPQHVFGLRLVSYERGDYYGAHVDEAVGGAFRADLSFSAVLQEPVDGGQLHVQGNGVLVGTGQIVLYPSTTVHEVTPVIEGRRIVLVGWIQSYVRDAAKRQLLADLQYVLENDYDANRVRAVRNELLRRWS